MVFVFEPPLEEINKFLWYWISRLWERTSNYTLWPPSLCFNPGISNACVAYNNLKIKWFPVDYPETRDFWIHLLLRFTKILNKLQLKKIARPERSRRGARRWEITNNNNDLTSFNPLCVVPTASITATACFSTNFSIKFELYFILNQQRNYLTWKRLTMELYKLSFEVEPATLWLSREVILLVEQCDTTLASGFILSPSPVTSQPSLMISLKSIVKRLIRTK